MQIVIFKRLSDESTVASEISIQLFLRWKVDELKRFSKKGELYYGEEKQSSLRRHKRKVMSQGGEKKS